MATPKKMHSFRISQQTQDQLANLADHYHCTKTATLERLIQDANVKLELDVKLANLLATPTPVAAPEPVPDDYIEFGV